LKLANSLYSISTVNTGEGLNQSTIFDTVGNRLHVTLRIFKWDSDSFEVPVKAIV